MRGKCALCLATDQELQLSHLVPKGVHIRVGADVTISPFSPHFSSSHQFAKHLLCKNCELLLSEKGENIFLRLCQQADGKFPLRDKLDKAKKIKALDPLDMVDQGELSDKERKALIHFGLGILWKGAQGDWQRNGEAIPMITLGKEYSEALRQYLLGLTDKIPARMSMTVKVATDSPSLQSTSPATRFWGSFNIYAVYALGVYYMMGVGKHVPEEISGLSIFRPPLHPILSGPMQEFLDFSTMRSAKMQPMTKALAKKYDKAV